jgi:hypothetical protein
MALPLKVAFEQKSRAILSESRQQAEERKAVHNDVALLKTVAMEKVNENKENDSE